MSARRFHADLGDGAALRPLATADAAELFALTELNRAYLRPWLPWVDTTTAVDDTRSYLESVQAQMESGSGLQLAVTVQGRIAGVAGFNSVDPANRVGSIGYWLSERHQGQGLMTRAVRALVALGFDELELNRIEIQVAKANARSRAIPIRLGFRFEGVRSQAERFRDRYVDLEVYALLARDRDG